MTLWPYTVKTLILKMKKDSLRQAMGSAGQILVVVYTFRGEEIRLISVRRATGREVKEYES